MTAELNCGLHKNELNCSGIAHGNAYFPIARVQQYAVDPQCIMRNTYYLLFCIILLWCRPTPGSWALCILDKEWSTAGLYKLRLNPTLVISPDFTLSAGAWRCHPFITLLRCVTPTHQGSKLGGRQFWALTLFWLIGLDLPCTYLCR